MDFHNSDMVKVVISEEQLQNRIKELAGEISKDYAGRELVLICVMNGSVFFTVDLMKNMNVKTEVDYISVGSYHGTESSGKVNLFRDISTDIENKDVLIIEDILDSGRTLSFLIEHFKAKKPSSLKVCSLLDKPDRRVFDIKLDYTGFEIEDIFIVGYGMDYEQRYRQVKYIGELKPEVYLPKEEKVLVTNV